MAKPTSKTAIANLALRHLKTDPVISIDPPDAGSKEASAAADWYDQARLDTLEAHPWRFASKRANLPADSAAPLFEWTKKYELPDDYVRLRYIGDNWRNPVTEYDIEDGYILCDETSPLPVVYVYDFKITSKFSPKFVTAMSYKLAAFMAYELTGNANLVEAMEAQFERAITQASSVAGQNRPPMRIEKSRIGEARRNLGRYRNWQNWGSD